MGKRKGASNDGGVPQVIRKSARRIEKYNLLQVILNNGYVVANTYLPKEIIVLILCYVDALTLSNSCMCVCKVWCDIIEAHVWKKKAELDRPHRFTKAQRYTRFPYPIYQSICLNDSFGRNLLKNNTGQNGFEHWTLLKDGYRLVSDRNHWKVECPPVGVVMPRNVSAAAYTSCFATSYYEGSKKQLVDLCKEGISPGILDLYQPDISISECYAARWRCSCMYMLQVHLLNENLREIKKEKFHFEVEIPINWSVGWKQVNHTFHNYGPGVRYVLFIHKGSDKRCRIGHCGSKMANACVKVEINGRCDAMHSRDDDDSDDDDDD